MRQGLLRLVNDFQARLQRGRTLAAAKGARYITLNAQAETVGIGRVAPLSDKRAGHIPTVLPWGETNLSCDWNSKIAYQPARSLCVPLLWLAHSRLLLRLLLR